jgi:hypothetical protein
VTPDDFTRTRRNPGRLSMRFDRQPDTTERLKAVIAGKEQRPSLVRRLVRLVTRT